MADLLLDIGSTFIKYSIYDTRTDAVPLTESAPFPAPETNDGVRYTVSLAAIRERIYEVLRRAKRYACTRAFISVQMHGYVLRDDTGCFTDYVSWRDKNGDPALPLFDGIDFDSLGTSRKSNLPLIKLMPKAPKGELFTLGSYVAWLLTGHNATHITDACASGFFFADTAGQNEYVKSLTVPTAYKAVTPVGEHDGMIVYSPTGDHQTGFLGSGAKKDEYLLNIGTATQISCLHGAGYAEKGCEKRPYFDGGRLYTVSGLCGGDLLYEGKGSELLWEQLRRALAVLPPKQRIVIGGGGAAILDRFLTERLKKMGLTCRTETKQIGLEGLKMLAKQSSIKVGTMLSEIAFSNFPLIAKKSGLNFVIVDNEHGAFDGSQIAPLAVEANLTGLDLIVRIGDSSRGHITKLADMGVGGFLLPMTNKPADIEQVIAYAKYPPIGKRGVSTMRAHTLYDPPKLSDYMVTANKKMKIYAQIETAEGVKNASKILSVPAVDGGLIGPNDLSVDIGCIGDTEKLIVVIKEIAQAAKAADKPFGIITSDCVLIAAAKAAGAEMFCVGSELNMLANGCKNIKECVSND